MAIQYYCPIPFFILNYDVRVICDYVSDTGTPADQADLTTANTQANNVLISIMTRATQKVKMAVRVSNRYTLQMLDDLYNDPASADPQYREYELYSLVGDIAFGLLISRRGLALEEVYKLAPQYKDALDTLERLKHNEAIFDDIGSVVAEAGVHVANIVPILVLMASRGFAVAGRYGRLWLRAESDAVLSKWELWLLEWLDEQACADVRDNAKMAAQLSYAGFQAFVWALRIRKMASGVVAKEF